MSQDSAITQKSFKHGDRVRMKNFDNGSKFPIDKYDIGVVEGLNVHGFWCIHFPETTKRGAIRLYSSEDEMLLMDCERSKCLGAR